MADIPASQFVSLPEGVYIPAAYASLVSSLSIHEKQELLYEAAKGCAGGREALECWTRKDLLQLLCHEMGKERKYTGLSKCKLVDLLLKLVTGRGTGEDVYSSDPIPESAPQSPPRRQRKAGRPSRVLSTSVAGAEEVNNKTEVSWICKNTACKAQLLPDASFCKRCSCCICQKFDDNKDPSLWIICTPEPMDVENSCGFSCHLECALNSRMAGVVIDDSDILLDGTYKCGSCGRISSLIGCWRKQLLVARDARRVDIFCHRLSLSHRLLNGTQKYQALHETIDKATKILEAEVGPLTEGSAKFARCIVNRLSSSTEIQKLISVALQEAEVLLEECGMSSQQRSESGNLEDREISSCTIEFNEVTPTSIMMTVKSGGFLAGEPVIGYKLWHRKASHASFKDAPSCVIPGNVLGKALFTDLEACSEYVFCIIPFTEKQMGEAFESRCFTKSIEVFDKPSNSNLDIAPNQHVVNENLDDFQSNFKVRDLGKLHTVWGQDHQSVGVNEKTMCGVRDVGCGDQKQDEQEIREKESETVKPPLGVVSPGVAASSVQDCACVAQHKLTTSDSNIAANGDSGSEEARVTFDVGVTVEPNKSLSRRESSGLFQESEVIQSPREPAVQAKLTEIDDASDLENSHTSRREETGAVSPNVSDSLQANGMNDRGDGSLRTDAVETHGHNESWAVQVRTVGTAVRVDSQTGITRKRGVGGLHGCFGLVAGCDESGTGAPLCAAKSYEFCVKIVRWLECEGHLKEDFRMKFLTWFSLRASDHEKRVVSVFIDTLQDDPASLAGQLVDTFTDVISPKRHQIASNGFCNRLWH